jgi:tetratricopeptide (TPR) repeat protein/transcriptional regulator with XRE-family HTH domain
MREVLRDRDFDAVFGFLGSRGWSRNAIAAATGLSETRVRAVLQGKQRITSYEVLERIADGLMIDRGLVGLAYAGQLDERPTGTADGVMEILTPASDVGDRRASAGDARHLRAQDGHQPLRAAPGTGSVHPHAYKVFQLPPDVTDFTGRSKAAAELTTLLTRGPVGNAVVVCVLSGKGGVGKTTLAVHVAHRVRRYFPDGQLYVDLRGVQPQSAEPGQVLGRFLNELGLDAESIPDQMEDRARLYRAQLAPRSVLVVLDNASDERQVRPLLPGNPECAVIVTSRKRLMGLDGAHQLPLEVMAAEQARELLAGVVGVSRTAAEPDATRAIVRYCGRLPLALRIAGARLASRPRESLASYAQRLHDERGRLDLLKAGDLEVRTTFALSYQSCDEEMQRVFRLLGILETPSFASWTLAALAYTTIGQAENLLEQLVDVELLEISTEDATGGRRYRFHDLLRVFARECLLEAEPTNERVAAAERLLREYVSLGGNAAALLEPGGLEEPVSATPVALAAVRHDPRGWFQSERSAFIGGVRLAFDLELWELSWRLAELLPALFRWQSDWADWAETHAIGLAAAQRCPSPEGEARIRCSLGLLYRAQGRFTEAIGEFERSAMIFSDSGDELRAAVARRQLGDTYRYTGSLEEGVSAFTESLDVFERHRSIRMTAGALNGLGDIYRGLSRWQESTSCFERSICLYESLSDDLAVARGKVRFGIVYRDRCLYDQAEHFYLAGLSTLREMSDRRWEARVLRHLGIVYRNTGRIAMALDKFEQGLAIFVELADHRGVAVTMRNTGDAYRYAGDLDKAQECLLDALRRFQDLGDERWTARTLAGLADVMRQRQEWAQAIEYLETALKTYCKIKDMPGQARACRSLAILYRDQQQWPNSINAFERSEALFASLGDQIWMARAMAGRAATQRSAGDGSWRRLQSEAEDICRASGATSDEQIDVWLHEW